MIHHFIMRPEFHHIYLSAERLCNIEAESPIIYAANYVDIGEMVVTLMSYRSIGVLRCYFAFSLFIIVRAVLLSSPCSATWPLEMGGTYCLIGAIRLCGNGEWEECARYFLFQGSQSRGCKHRPSVWPTKKNESLPVVAPGNNLVIS